MTPAAIASSANVAIPGSRIAAIARSTKNVIAAIPGSRPITVPSRKSLHRMCEAPATTFTIENGAIGSMVIPAGLAGEQRLLLVEKDAAGTLTTTDVLAVRFSELEGTDSPSSSVS